MKVPLQTILVVDQNNWKNRMRMAGRKLPTRDARMSAHDLQQKASSNVPVWFERKFDFTFPGEHFPNVCVRLRGTPVRLEEMLREVSHDVLVAKPGEKWSAQEHAGHLLDLESLWLARVEDFLGNGDTLTLADLSNRKTHEANHNGRELTELLGEFRRARARLMDRVGRLQPTLLARSMLHPRLKQPMRLVDHLYFVAEHDDHHLAKIWEMISAG